MSRPLNFLHLTTFFPPYSFGGDAMYIYRLTHALGDEGHNVDVVHCVDSYHLLHAAEPEIQFAEHPKVKRHELRSGYKWLSPLLTQQTGHALLKHQKIREVMQSKPYDVVHYHNTSLLGPEILALSPSGSVPVKIYTTHEHWLVCPTHVLWKFGNRPCDKPECFRCTVLAKRPPQLWRYTNLLTRTAAHVDQFVSPSRFTARVHAERGFSQPVDCLPYFIDRVDHEWRNPRPRPHSKPYFLFVGRLETIKGLHTLIDAWKKIGNYDLLIAGAGEEKAALQKQAATNPRIKFLGMLNQVQLGAFYHHALACIVPSITYETFGIIILESFARRTPVIVRDLGALPEVVNDSGGGFIYSDEAGLISAINDIGTKPVLREELGRKGYETFVANWSREAHLRQYFNLLGRAARKKHGFLPWEDDYVEASTEDESIPVCP